MPVLVIVQRRVGQVRARIAGETQESLARADLHHPGDPERLRHPAVEVVQSAARRVGSLQRRERQTGRSAGAAGDERSGLLRGRAGAHGERSRSHLPVSRATSSRAGTDLITAGTIVAFTTVQARLLMPLHGSHARRARRADFAGPVRPHLRIPRPRAGDHAMPPTRSGRRAPGPIGRVEFRDVVFRYPDAGADARADTAAASRSRPSRASTSRSSGPPVPARRRCSI